MEKVLKAIQAQEQALIEFLRQIVNIDSCYDDPEGNLKVAQLIGGMLDKMGFTVEYLKYPGICTHVKAFKKRHR